MDNKKTGIFISELRKEKGLNQKEFAEKINVTDKAVSKWETGRGFPDISLLIPIANELGVSVSEILSGEKNHQQEPNSENDAKLVKKLKIERIIRLIVELSFGIIIAFLIGLSFNEIRGYLDYLSMIVYGEIVAIMTLRTVIFVFIFIFWIVLVAVTAVLQKKAIVVKSVVVCLIAAFAVGSYMYISDMKSDIILNEYEVPVDTVKYIKYDELFDGEYSTKIKIIDCYDPVSDCYEATVRSTNGENYISTFCAVFSDNDSIESALKGRVARKEIYEKYNFYEVDYNFRQKTGITQGFIVEDLDEDIDVALCLVKGNNYYEIETSLTDFDSEALLNQIASLP